MSRRKSVVQIGMCTSNIRRSPRLGKQIEAKLGENFKNPSFESVSGLRRSPRNVKLGDMKPKTPDLESESVSGLRRSPRNVKLGDMKPKTPNLESRVRRSRARSCFSLRPCGVNGNVRDNECVADASRKEEEAENCFGSEQRRSPRFGKTKKEQLNGLKIGAVEKKSSAEVRIHGGGENVGEERAGLRRSQRFLNQRKNDSEANCKSGSLLNKICDNVGDSREQTVKGNQRKSVTPVESEEEWSQSKETRLKNEGKEAGAGNKKRKRGKEGSTVVGGWTKEQEMALERAYLAMKPTPQFWKKVSKMVGKTDQFNHPQPPATSYYDSGK